jgi:hypothetical protein
MLAIVHHLAGMAKRGRPKKNPAPQSNQKTAQQSAQSSRGEMESFRTPPVVTQQPIGDVRTNETEIESAKWASSLILYVIGETPTIKDLNTDIANQWKVSHPPEIFYHSEGYFVIRFEKAVKAKSGWIA